MATKQKKNKRKICFVITSFIHYSRGVIILEELRKRSDVELHIVVAGTALLTKYSSKYAHVRELLEKDGFDNIHELHFNLEGDMHSVKAKTTGLGIIEFSTLFNAIKPDLVVVRGDRFEVLSAVVSAAYLHIPIAHIEGGDVSGTMDESVRHAITKLSHIHFTTNEDARQRVLRMGERESYVFNFGSPDIEVAEIISKRKPQFDLSSTGSGADIDANKPYLMVMYHPVTTELDKMPTYTRMLLDVIHSIGMPTFWFWPNFDAGADSIAHELRAFKDRVPDHAIRFMRYLPPQEFLWMLSKSSCLVGNSSAGIKECSYLGVPVVNIGSRQDKRLRANNVISLGNDPEEIKSAILNQITAKRYPKENIYRKEKTAKNIAATLAKIPLYVQKQFSE